ncbi:hypothetical protein SPSIL_011890 [Sporomusa silvacetica DSM 10669]|uniref:Adhesin YadA n=1 Tax=Sporomusa silvacetica DSM 10669 TaxID=1123289 RepID=A0ABZ3IHD6_9FIRM|nr:YadA-like family protein [Sporomusa silvacetica]OZC22071.1 adhesin YadA precursor [Sporomusa silvacetica DSM 10669]
MRKGKFLKSAVITFVFFLVSSAAIPVLASDYIAGDGTKVYYDQYTTYDSSTPTAVGDTTIGENASTGMAQSTAIGSSANAASITYAVDISQPFEISNSMAVGYDAQAAGMAVGSSAHSGKGTAIGYTSYAVNGYAIGASATCTGDSMGGSVVVGAGASTDSSSATVIGRNANALSNDSTDATAATVLGDGATAGVMGTAYGCGATANARNSTAIGAGASANAKNSVALGAGSVANRANTVSVGSAGNERQITNVADGTAATDVINVRQLNEFGRKIDKVGAMSAAISGLRPMPHDPKAPLQLLAGGGNYSGRWAAAVGVGYYAHEKFLLKFGMAFCDSEKMGQLGLEWKWGRSGKKATTTPCGDSTVTALQATARQLQDQIKQQQDQTQKQQDQQQDQIKQLQDQIKRLLNTQENLS